MRIRHFFRALFAHPKREGEWTCSACGTTQGTGRAHCMNGCGSRGPLAPPPRPTEAEAAS